MSIRAQDFISYVLLFIVSAFLVFDLFSSDGLSATFDGRMHATMIAQFTDAFRDGEVRVTWSDGFGNYGMPMALINHQIIGYGGGLINLFFDNVVLSTNILLLLGAFFSAVLFYTFLRIYFTTQSSFLGAFFFSFSSYRIFNLYVRGAYPEFLASIFLPLVLIGLHSFIVNKNRFALILIAISIAGIILTHPFTLIIYSFIFIPYLIYLLHSVTGKVKPLFLVAMSFGIGVMLSGYYFIPLLLETKYFYYGQTSNHLILDQFLSFQNYFNERWFYFFNDNPFVRGNYLNFGFIESIILLLGVGVVLYHTYIKKLKNIGIVVFALVSGGFLVFFTTSLSEILYNVVPTLSNIQYPWRMLSGLIFISPIILAFTVDLLSKNLKVVVILLILFCVAFLRFPQLYGKNFTKYPEDYYYKTDDNVAAVVLNPIWTGVSEDYPVRSEQAAIIEGEGRITEESIKNSSRRYSVESNESLRLVDYTFYFPGWNVLIDETATEIEYQDPAFRGVITYRVPPGKHVVDVLFTDTKIRLLGLLVSGGGVVLLTFGLLFMKYKKKLFI